MADRVGQCAMLRGRVNQWPGLCSEVPVVPLPLLRRTVMHRAHVAPRDACRATWWSLSSSAAGRHARASMSRVTHAHAHASPRAPIASIRRDATVATVTRIHRPHRHSIATAPFRHDLDQRMCVSAIHRVHGTAGAAARNHSFLHRAVAGARSHTPISSHRRSADTGSQTNDRFKRGAGYLGTAVSSNTRSGRRWWPGQ